MGLPQGEYQKLKKIAAATRTNTTAPEGRGGGQQWE